MPPCARKQVREHKHKRIQILAHTQLVVCQTCECLLHSDHNVVVKKLDAVRKSGCISRCTAAKLIDRASLSCMSQQSRAHAELASRIVKVKEDFKRCRQELRARGGTPDW